MPPKTHEEMSIILLISTFHSFLLPSSFSWLYYIFLVILFPFILLLHLNFLSFTRFEFYVFTLAIKDESIRAFHTSWLLFLRAPSFVGYLVSIPFLFYSIATVPPYQWLYIHNIYYWKRVYEWIHDTVLMGQQNIQWTFIQP